MTFAENISRMIQISFHLTDELLDIALFSHTHSSRSWQFLCEIAERKKMTSPVSCVRSYRDRFLCHNIIRHSVRNHLNGNVSNTSRDPIKWRRNLKWAFMAFNTSAFIVVNATFRRRRFQISSRDLSVGFLLSSVPFPIASAIVSEAKATEKTRKNKERKVKWGK